MFHYNYLCFRCCVVLCCVVLWLCCVVVVLCCVVVVTFNLIAYQCFSFTQREVFPHKTVPD